MTLTCIECSTTLDVENRSDHIEMCISCYEEQGITKKFNKITKQVDIELPLNIKYATELKKRFGIFAFSCSCNGAHPDCAFARENIIDKAQMDMLRRVCDWLEKQ